MRWNGLAAGSLAAGDAHRAEEWLRQAVACDRFRESAVRQLLQLLHDSGRTTEAGAVYRSLVEAFRRERPDQIPETSTRELFKRVTQSPENATSLRELPKANPSAHILPIPVSYLIGRDRECDAVTAKFSSSRLVTLIGPGGIGKTRLALEVAHRIASRYVDGAAFVDLTALPAGDELQPVLQAVAAALTVSGRAVDQKGEEALSAALNGSSMLLIVDNCEQVAVPCATLIAYLLRRVKGLHVLATSRETLRIAGERPYRVPPLMLPPVPSVCTPATVMESAAGRLFIDRVSLPNYVVTEDESRLVGWICRTLDGIPLAIELAAAAVDRLESTAGVVEAMQASFWFLQEGDRTGPDRYQTLRSTVEWSYLLLAPLDRTFLHQSSLLLGGGTSATFGAICAIPDPTLALERLRAAFLVVTDGPQRYRLPEPVRQYAQEALVASGEAETVAQRHAVHFTELSEVIEKEAIGVRQAELFERLEMDRANFHVALMWAKRTREEGAGEIGHRLIAALWKFWMVKGGLRAAEEIAAQILSAIQKRKPSPHRLKALNGAGNMAFLLGDYGKARDRFAACQALARQLHDLRAEAMAVGGLANVAQSTGDYATARAGFEACLHIFHELKDEERTAVTFGNLANLASYQADYAAAIHWHEQCLGLLRQGGDTHDLALALNNLAHTLLLSERFIEVMSVLAEVFRVSASVGSKRALLQGMSIAMTLSIRAGDLDRAATLLAFSEHQREAAQIALPEGAKVGELRLRQECRDQLGEVAFRDAQARGREMETAEAVALAAHCPLPVT